MRESETEYSIAEYALQKPSSVVVEYESISSNTCI